MYMEGSSKPQTTPKEACLHLISRVSSGFGIVVHCKYTINICGMKKKAREWVNSHISHCLMPWAEPSDRLFPNASLCLMQLGKLLLFLVVSLKEHVTKFVFSSPFWFENEVRGGRECVSQQALQFSRRHTTAKVYSQKQNSGQADTKFAILCSPV